MESGTIVRWLKSEGEAVAKGEPLFELDTDKVTQEVEAETDGVLLKIAVAEGEVPVGQTVAFIGEQGETVPEVADETSATPAAEEASNSLLQAKEEPVPAPAASGNGRIKASPLASRRASAESIWPRCVARARRVGSSRRTSSKAGGASLPLRPQVTVCYKRSRRARRSGSRLRASVRPLRAGSRRPGRSRYSSSRHRRT